MPNLPPKGTHVFFATTYLFSSAIEGVYVPALYTTVAAHRDALKGAIPYVEARMGSRFGRVVLRDFRKQTRNTFSLAEFTAVQTLFAYVFAAPAKVEVIVPAEVTKLTPIVFNLYDTNQIPDGSLVFGVFSPSERLTPDDYPSQWHLEYGVTQKGKRMVVQVNRMDLYLNLSYTKYPITFGSSMEISSATFNAEISLQGRDVLLPIVLNEGLVAWIGAFKGVLLEDLRSATQQALFDDDFAKVFNLPAKVTVIVVGGRLTKILLEDSDEPPISNLIIRLRKDRTVPNSSQIIWEEYYMFPLEDGGEGTVSIINWVSQAVLSEIEVPEVEEVVL